MNDPLDDAMYGGWYSLDEDEPTPKKPEPPEEIPFLER